MIPFRLPHRASTRPSSRPLRALLVLGALPFGLGRLGGQVPVVPRAEPIIPRAAPAAEVAAPAAPATPAGAETDPAPPEIPSSLAAMVREDNPFALVLEPAGSGSEVFVPIPGAKSSGLAAARWKNGVMRPYSRTEFRALGMKWKEFRAKGIAVAETHLAAIDPIIDRDARGTVEIVRFISESPLTATGIFTGTIRKRLEDVLGLPFYAAAPSRSVIIAFSKTGADPAAIGALASGLFNDSIYPASLEIFEVGKETVRSVGTFKKD